MGHSRYRPGHRGRSRGDRESSSRLVDLVSILQHAGLIDAQHHWTGGKATLVQVGDLLDRGPKPREVMDLVMSLEKEAAKAGGRVVSLLGNHEMMNIMGDLRYVTPGNY